MEQKIMEEVEKEEGEAVTDTFKYQEVTVKKENIYLVFSSASIKLESGRKKSTKLRLLVQEVLQASSIVKQRIF